MKSGLNIYHLSQYHQPLILKLWIKTFSHTPYGVTKFAGTTFPSVLKKLTAVSESLAHQKYYFCYREDKFKCQDFVHCLFI